MQKWAHTCTHTETQGLVVGTQTTVKEMSSHSQTPKEPICPRLFRFKITLKSVSRVYLESHAHQCTVQILRVLNSHPLLLVNLTIWKTEEELRASVTSKSGTIHPSPTPLAEPRGTSL